MDVCSGDHHSHRIADGQRDQEAADQRNQERRPLGPGDPVVDVSPRTVRNWVKRAAEAIAKGSGDDDWYKVSAHDCRRTWASALVSDGMPSDLVMDWGGWEDHDTFRDHYWNPDEEIIAEHLERIGLV